MIAEAGVAKATLYAHFPAKDDLLLAVLARREEATADFLRAGMGRHHAAGPLAAFFAALKDWFAAPGFRGCAFVNAAVELADPDHPGHGFARGYKRRFHAMLADLLRQVAGPAGDAALPAVTMLVEGAIITAVLDGSPAAADVAHAATARLLRAG